MKVHYLLLLGLLGLAVSIPVDELEGGEDTALAPVEDFSGEDYGLDDFGENEDTNNDDEDLRGGRRWRDAVHKVKRIFHKPNKKVVKVITIVHSPIHQKSGRSKKSPIAAKLSTILPENGTLTDNYVGKLKSEIEISHITFMKVYNAEMDKWRNLTRKSHITEEEYKKAQKHLADKYAEWRQSLDDLKAQNSTLANLKYKDADYQNEMGLLSYLYEYVKIFRSLKQKDAFLKHSCICNTTKI